MNDNELIDRIAQSNTWTEQLEFDPGADLRRGRQRLRRWRGLVAGTAVLVTTAVIVTGFTLGRPDDQGQPPTVGVTTPTTPKATQTAPKSTPTVAKTAPAAPKGYRRNYFPAFAGNVDPGRRYLRDAGTINQDLPDAIGLRMTRDAGGVQTNVTWRENGGVGYGFVNLLYASTRSGRPGGLPALKAWTPGTCVADGTASTFDHCEVTSAPGGQQVTVGTRGKQAFFASYRRPDGNLAIAVIDGDGRNHDTAGTGPKPVAAPSLQLDDLVAAVIDPSLTLP